LAQIGLFVLLGLLVNPSELAGDVVGAIVVGLVLLLVARPLSVVGSLALFRIPWRQQVFLSWAGLRGAVPIVLATFPVVAGVPDSHRLLNIVFMLVVVFTLVQGPSLGPIAQRLGLISREATREIQVEAAPLDMLDAELLTMTVQAPSRLHNVTILELRLPDPAVITLIIRDGHTFVPIPDTRIEAGDELLIVTTSKTRAAAESRLRAVSRRGKLAHWFDEYGDVE
jgi:cell volume regulation protein A